MSETIYRLLKAKTTAQTYQHKDDVVSATSPPMSPLDHFLNEISEILEEQQKQIDELENWKLKVTSGMASLYIDGKTYSTTSPDYVGRDDFADNG